LFVKTNTSSADSASEFISKFNGQISGILHGFDRLRLRGTLRHLYSHTVMEAYLNAQHILIKDFGAYVERTSAAVRAAANAFAESWRRPVLYLPSNQRGKEEVAREIAKRDRIERGLIAVLSAVEPCKSFSVVGNAQTKQIELRLEPRKCLHYYFYFEHERFGFMHFRLQTWFPFQIDICINGRHWLARQLEANAIGFLKRENAIIWTEDMPAAQKLLDEQIRLDLRKELDLLLQTVHPLSAKICQPLHLEYYWTVAESEYASDVLFKRPEELSRIYPSLVDHALRSFGSGDVMRFLGRKVPATGTVSGHFKGEIISDLKRRPEGIRVKHSLDGNSLKLFDKQGSVLRVETTINHSDQFAVFRPTTNHPKGPCRWRRLRRSVADIGRRAQVCRASNGRYLRALAATADTIPLFQWAKEACEPVRRHGRRYRALNPLANADALLLEAVNRGEFAINGFRNRQLRELLYPGKAPSKKIERAGAAATRRRILLLRVHGLVRKIGNTRAYILTDKGRVTITALLTARRANTQELTKLAA
jgi:hypothetical protein